MAYLLLLEYLELLLQTRVSFQLVLGSSLIYVIVISNFEVKFFAVSQPLILLFN